jgi:hypothetical protein
MARKLWINGKLATINGKTRGYIIYQGVSYEWDNNGTQPTIALTLITSDDKWFITYDDKYFVIVTQASANVSQGLLSVEHNGTVTNKVFNMAQGTVNGDVLYL